MYIHRYVRKERLSSESENGDCQLEYSTDEPITKQVQDYGSRFAFLEGYGNKVLPEDLKYFLQLLIPIRHHSLC